MNVLCAGVWTMRQTCQAPMSHRRRGWCGWSGGVTGAELAPPICRYMIFSRLQQHAHASKPSPTHCARRDPPRDTPRDGRCRGRRRRIGSKRCACACLAVDASMASRVRPRSTRPIQQVGGGGGDGGLHASCSRCCCHITTAACPLDSHPSRSLITLCISSLIRRRFRHSEAD